MYKVDLSTKPQKFYRKADRPLARKPARCFEQLERDPRKHNNIKLLSGKLAKHYRYRVGDHRVIYRIDEPQQIVFVVQIAHRSEAYESIGHSLSPVHVGGFLPEVGPVVRGSPDPAHSSTDNLLLCIGKESCGRPRGVLREIRPQQVVMAV